MRRARILTGVIVAVLVGASCSRSGGQDSATAAASTTVVYGSTSAPGRAATASSIAPGSTASSGAPTARFDESAGQPPGITVQNGTHASLADQGDYVIVRNADDAAAAARALEAFRAELMGPGVFASQDGEYGVNTDGTPIRFTIPYTSFEMTPEGPTLYFDSEDALSQQYDIVKALLLRLGQLLRDAGVQRAEIGTPPK